MASTGSGVSHRGTMEGMASAIGADTHFVASGNLAENLTEDTQIVNDDNSSNQQTQQSADTAADTAAEIASLGSQ